MTVSPTSEKYTPEQRKLLGQAYRMILGWGMRSKKGEPKASDAGQDFATKPPAMPAQQRGSHE